MEKNQKPLRQEDYFAMAETLRRVQVENEAFKRKLARKPFPWKRVGYVVGVVAIAMAALFLLHTAIVAIADDARATTAHPAQRRPCYFVRHHIQDDDGEPWEKWHVFKSGCEAGCNSRVDLEPQTPGAIVEPTFNAKDEAWKWATDKWHLNMCE